MILQKLYKNFTNIGSQIIISYKLLTSFEKEYIMSLGSIKMGQTSNLKNLEPTSLVTTLTVDTIYAAFAYVYSPAFVFKGETHKAWELVYAHKGEVVIETPERTQILHKGEAFIHKPYEFHKIRANNTACNMIFLSFDTESEELFLAAGKPLVVSQSQVHTILRIADECAVSLAGKNSMPDLEKDKKPEFAASQIIKNLLEVLLIDFIRQVTGNSPEKLSQPTLYTEKSIVQSAISYMQNNLTQKLTLQDIAAQVGYSASYLSSVFRKTMNISVINYCILLKIEKAKKLIAEGNKNINEIAEILDFNSVQYFSTQFKKITKMTPTQFASAIKLSHFHFDSRLL